MHTYVINHLYYVCLQNKMRRYCLHYKNNFMHTYVINNSSSMFSYKTERRTVSKLNVFYFILVPRLKYIPSYVGRIKFKRNLCYLFPKGIPDLLITLQ